MKHYTKLLAFAAMMSLLFGCATSGPKFIDMKNSISEVSSDTGRIFIYRKSALGAAIQPKVFINDEEVGKAVPHGFFYVDRSPGNYVIKTSTEVKRTLSLNLDKGQTRFVRLNISPGFFVGHVYPELVENEVGESEMQKLHYLRKE